MPNTLTPDGTEMDCYLAALLDSKGGLQIRRTTKVVHLQLDFGGDPSIPRLLRNYYGIGTAVGGLWRVTNVRDLQRVLTRALPYMHHRYRRGVAEYVLAWTQAASYRKPDHSTREAAWRALT